MTKPRLTHDEHTELGAALAGIRDELLHRSVQLANAYPRSGPEAEAGKLIQQVVDDLDRARSTLEDRLFAEHPDIAETQVYYPAEEGRAMVVVPGPRRVR